MGDESEEGVITIDRTSSMPKIIAAINALDVRIAALERGYPAPVVEEAALIEEAPVEPVEPNSRRVVARKKAQG
jgi:hypothetical protein